MDFGSWEVNIAAKINKKRMHEASLVQGLLKIAIEALQDYKNKHGSQAAGRITKIRCEAGLMACFEPETLRACFEIFAEGTPAENADLQIETAPLPCKCGACGARFELKRRKFVCPQCGADEVSFSGGNGLTLLAINVEIDNKAD